MGLNICEARVFSNTDAYSLEVSWCMDGLLRFLNNKLLILLKVHLWTHIWINSLFSYLMFVLNFIFMTYVRKSNTSFSREVSISRQTLCCGAVIRFCNLRYNNFVAVLL